MSRKSTGTVRILRDANGERRWHAKWTRSDGSRSDWLPIPGAPIALDDIAAAKAEAARLAPKIRRESANLGTGETCDDYFGRLATAREAEGIVSVRKDKYDWGKWIAPRIGKLPIAVVTRDEIEDVRNVLDDEVKKRLSDGLKAGMSGKTAANIWSVVRTTFKEAVGARDRELRVRTDDPSAGHKPPLETPERAKTFLYPVEATALLACEEVPIEWRQAYAVAMYLFVRPEELEALTWADVDFTASLVSISRAVDARTGKAKPMPKTANAVRDVPIEPALLPLLKAMHEGRASDDAPVVPVLGKVNDKFRAKLLRAHLLLASVKRARLTADTLTLRPLDFRSMRDTGITWLALSGLSLHAVQRRCGHEDIDTTNGYVKMAEDLSGTIGEPFPPLPPGLSRIDPNSPGSIQPLDLTGKPALLGAGGGNRTPDLARMKRPL